MDLAKHIKPLAGEADWPIWKRKIRDLLDYHEGALDVIDNKIKKPEPLADGASAAKQKEFKEKYDFFRKANSYAKSMIASSVTDAVYEKIIDKETARDAFEALKEQFEATSKDQVFQICDSFFAFSWMSGEDVSTHLAKLRSLWSDLNNGLTVRNENKLPDLMLVCKTLNILPAAFETFRSSWMLLTKDTEKTFDELTTQLCMFERNFKKSTNNDKFSQEALVAKGETQKQDAKKKSRAGTTCNYCGKKNHWVSECRKWIADGRPSKNKSVNDSQNQANHKNNQNKFQSNAVEVKEGLVLSFSEIFNTEINTTDWWIDNGATRHATNNFDFFVDFEKFKNPCGIKAAGKELLQAVGKGIVKVVSTVNDERYILTLHDVWYVPDISKNLFSVLAAQDRNLNSMFESTATRCSLKVNNKILLSGVRNVHGTLFKAAIKPIFPAGNVSFNVAVTDSSQLQLYHERWGHQDKQHVKNLLQKELGINVKLDREICEPCVYGKAHRLAFGTRRKASQPGELIATDLCGPFDVSFSKKRYMAIFKDMFTKFRYCYIIAEKSDVTAALQSMIAHAKQQGHSIKALLSDNGGEFDNVEVKAILEKNGITHRLTAPYTPQQNGCVERENRTIVEMARTFKYSNPDVKFPEAIWAELVTTATYVLNRTGKSSVDGVSPYELWIGSKPRIKHLRIIASTCYVHIPKEKRRKMDEKAIKGYLIGYDNDERYRIYVKEEHKVIVSRDVQFRELTRDCDHEVQLPLKDSHLQKDNTEENPEVPVELEEPLEYPEIPVQQDEPLEYESESTEPESATDDEEEPATPSPVPARTLRDRSKLRKPSYLQEYAHIAENTDFIDTYVTPQSFQEAVSGRESLQWKRAMDDEMKSLNENHTWKLSTLPQGAKAIPCKWTYRVKTNPDGSVNRYKARLVIKGFSQRYGIDYSQTFSPVARMATIRSILSIAASEQMHLAQFDVSTAFLYGELEEVIYMQQPEGYKNGTDQVCQLQKSLYGLKQASRCWFKRFGKYLISLGFKVSDADPCLFMRKENDKSIIMALYVDDGLVAATDPQDLKIFLQDLSKEFKITSQKASYFLGLEIEQTDDYITINQQAFAKKILERFNFSDCKPVSTPMLKASEISQPGKENSKAHNFPYRQAVGALMYLMLGTRPDLAYSVGFLSRSLENPSLEDVARVKRVFRYVAGTLTKGITYTRKVKRGILETFSDADFGGCTKTGRSTSGVVVKYAGGAISWMSQRQPTVATSTTEAEIIAASEAAKEIIWLSRLFKNIVTLKQVPIIEVDNTAAVRLSENPEFHRRTKHIAIKHFFIREMVTEGELAVQQISSENQLADIMTKPLGAIRLQILRDKLGLK